MLVSHRYKFIYLKTVKTGGTSVESYFEKFCMHEGEWEFAHKRDEYESKAGIIGYRGKHAKQKAKKWYNHQSAAEIKSLLGDEIWDDYYKFCVIRNPFDKLISGYYFNEHRKKNRTFGEKTKVTLRNIIKKGRFTDYKRGNSEIESFRNWIKSGGKIFDRNKYVLDGKICVDYFIRQELMNEGIKEVCEKLNIPYEVDRIPQLKGGIRKSKRKVKDYYDEETIAIVKNIYDLELEYFGYTLEE